MFFTTIGGGLPVLIGAGDGVFSEVLLVVWLLVNGVDDVVVGVLRFTAFGVASALVRMTLILTIAGDDADSNDDGKDGADDGDGDGGGGGVMSCVVSSVSMSVMN